GAALLLATLGVYAVVAFSVSRRSQEMGLRLALGAEPGAIRRQVAREGMIYPALGLVAGFGASIAVSRMLQSSLYEVAPGEIRFSLLALGLLALAAAAGCLVPASRATRIDPAVTLRAD
ncbi:MAG TPA: FtsX-like permease family protein, partial [Gemmatimonadales bacterium]|nr:FtsX-like permease family protein [Gemmatimonadales bacterium]